MLFSNKGMLPILWELNPGHPNLLPAYDSPEPLRGNYVRKPVYGREGSNVDMVCNGKSIESTPGTYGAEGFVYQAPGPQRDFGGNFPVLGLWIIGGECCGMGIREDSKKICGNLSCFLPHYFD